MDVMFCKTTETGDDRIVKSGVFKFDEKTSVLMRVDAKGRVSHVWMPRKPRPHEMTLTRVCQLARAEEIFCNYNDFLSLEIRGMAVGPVFRLTNRNA